MLLIKNLHNNCYFLLHFFFRKFLDCTVILSIFKTKAYYTNVIDIFIFKYHELKNKITYRYIVVVVNTFFFNLIRCPHDLNSWIPRFLPVRAKCVTFLSGNISRNIILRCPTFCMKMFIINSSFYCITNFPAHYR